jgi:hypothetical protein
VFRFVSSDLARGTPHPRGRGRLPEPVTWHATMLANVGWNGEGPLPWVERDYTPISDAKAWEQGRCDVLAKVYADGAATSWLKRVSTECSSGGSAGVPLDQVSTKSPGPRVLLSKPARTLSVPGWGAQVEFS